MKVSETTSRRMAVAAAVIFGGVAAFQVALALGAPLGAAAWGGAEVVLSSERRVASAIAAGVLLLSAVVACGRAGMLTRTPGWMRVFRVAIWLIVAQMALNTLANLASPSSLERAIMTPLTVTLCVLCVLLARSPVPPGAQPRS